MNSAEMLTYVLRDVDHGITDSVRIAAADRIVALEAWKDEAMEVLRPFVRIAEAEDFAGTKDGESIFVNVNLCRAARRLVEKEEGR